MICLLALCAIISCLLLSLESLFSRDMLISNANEVQVDVGSLSPSIYHQSVKVEIDGPVALQVSR
jgi:hypothetical protein